MRASRLAVFAAALGACCCAATTPASADSAKCTVQGSVKLSPGLSERPKVQGIQIKGTLSGCSVEGSSYTGGTFRIQERTVEPVTCSALSSGVAGESGTIEIVWKPKPPKGFRSRGSATVPLIEGSAALGGTIAHWAFGEGELQGSLTELYAGGPSCANGAKVKKGTVSGTLSVT